MRSRADAVSYFEDLVLDLERHPQAKGAWHIGIIEVRKLLDFIYGEPPLADDEVLLTVAEIKRMRGY